MSNFDAEWDVPCSDEEVDQLFTVTATGMFIVYLASTSNPISSTWYIGLSE